MTKMAKGRNENHKLNNIKLSRENTKCGEAALFICCSFIFFYDGTISNVISGSIVFR